MSCGCNQCYARRGPEPRPVEQAPRVRPVARVSGSDGLWTPLVIALAASFIVILLATVAVVGGGDPEDECSRAGGTYARVGTTLVGRTIVSKYSCVDPTDILDK